MVVVGLTAFLLLGAAFAHVTVGFPGSWDPSRYQTLPDAASDWLTIRAAVDGTSPYLPVDELAARHDVPVDDLPDAAVHPRFPGALVLQLPLLAVSWSSVLSWMTVVNLVALVFVGWWLWRWRGTRAVPLALPFLVLTPLFLELVGHGGHVGPLVLLLTAAWWLASEGNERSAGVAVGALATLRGFPLLLVPALWLAGRRSAAWWSAGVFLALNALGMAAFGLAPGEVASGLSAGAGLFGTDAHNASVAGLLQRFGMAYELAALLGLLGVLGWWAWSMRGRGRSLDRYVGITVPAMVLAAPLSWPSYHLLFLPVVAWWIAADRSRAAKLTAATAGGAYGAWHVAGTWISGGVSALVSAVVAGASAHGPGIEESDPAADDCAAERRSGGSKGLDSGRAG